MNSRLLSLLKALLFVQYLVQCFNIYGLNIRSMYWPRIIFPIYAVFASPIFSPIFNAFDEKKSHLLIKPKSSNLFAPASGSGGSSISSLSFNGLSLLDLFLFVIISLAAIGIPPFSSELSLSSCIIQLISSVIAASPLWIAHPYDLLITSQYFKVPLFESALLLISYWSCYITFFIVIYPPLSLATEFHPILYEPLPLLLHIIFVHLIVVLWLATMIFTHHRMQFIVDTRRCGVWILKSEDTSSSSASLAASATASASVTASASASAKGSSSSSTTSASATVSHKTHQWKPGHSYRLHDVCHFDDCYFQLISPFSSYSLPPSFTALPYRAHLYTILNKESGALSQSFVLTCLLQCLSIIGCSLIVVGLLYPRQQQIGFFLHGFLLSVLLYDYQKSFLSPRLVSANGVITSQSSDGGHYVYHPYQINEPSTDTVFPPAPGHGSAASSTASAQSSLPQKNKGGASGTPTGSHRSRSTSGGGGNELS